MVTGYQGRGGNVWIRPYGPRANRGILLRCAGEGMSSAKFDRMDRFEIIEEIGSILSWFGQMFGQDSARKLKPKA